MLWRLASKYGSSYNIKCYINYSLLLSLNNMIAEASEDILLAPFEVDLKENIASSILGTDTFKAIEEVDKELAELYLPNIEAEDKLINSLNKKEPNYLFTGELANYNKNFDLDKSLEEICYITDSDSITYDKIKRLLEAKDKIIKEVDDQLKLLKLSKEPN